MHILLTGATGYIGKRLLPVLIEAGYQVSCCVRDPERFQVPGSGADRVRVIQADFSQEVSVPDDMPDIDAAFYLIHSLSGSTSGYLDHEQTTARNFTKFVEDLHVRQVIYLGGISHEEELSEHLASRKAVESVLTGGDFNTSILRAGIIVGSGSASFEIIRDLVEKLPVMLAPRWINTQCQPIAVKNVIQYLTGVLGLEQAYNQTFDIGGPDILSYKKMMLDFAAVRDLKRWIFTIPVMTPRLSSYWLYFITATNYTLAVNLVKSMKVPVVCNENRIRDLINLDLIPYTGAVKRAFGRMEQNMVVSSWIDALSSGNYKTDLSQYVKVPEHGCLIDKTTVPLKAPVGQVVKKMWSIGGDNGWYYASFLWQLRGFIDKVVGGVGLRRGRKNQDNIHPGDALDFWRVLVADKKEKRLLLFAEMKLPGEAWLEFRIEERGGEYLIKQTATFRPRGLSGRIYWYSVSLFHLFVFNGMAQAIARG